MQQERIGLEHQAGIREYLERLGPYSDFNFTSLWAWDINGRLRLAEHEGSLVARFTDYLTGVPFYSFLGDGDTNRTAMHLIDLSQQEGLAPALRMVPEPSIHSLDPRSFLVTESLNHFDYVFDTTALATAVGGDYLKIRQLSNKFMREYAESDTVHIWETNMQDARDHIEQVSERWLLNKAAHGEDIDLGGYDHEEVAISRMFSGPTEHLRAVCAAHEGRPIAFTVNDLSHSSHAIAHFAKADMRYPGIVPYMMRKTCEILATHNKRYLNAEQDLGVPGLRRSKHSFRPCGFLKKYTIELR